MYTFSSTPNIDKIFNKISKKNPNLMKIISKKVNDILKNPNHYKNLKKPLENFKRVHIDTNFVLLFSVDENTKTVCFEDFDHHDNIYL